MDILITALNGMVKVGVLWLLKGCLYVGGFCCIVRMVLWFWMDSSTDDPGAREFFDGPKGMTVPAFVAPGPAAPQQLAAESLPIPDGRDNNTP